MRRLDTIFQMPFFRGTPEYDEVMQEIDNYLSNELHLDYEKVYLNYTYIITENTTIYPVNVIKLQIKIEYNNEETLDEMQLREEEIVQHIQRIVWEVH